MPMTDNDRLRRMVGDRIPLGKDEGDAFFSNEELTDMLAEAGGNLNLAAVNGWLAKMAEFAKLIDTDISGANRKFSQMYKNAESMFEHYASVIGADTAAIVGRVVGRAVSLRETPCRPRVMATSSGFRLEAVNPEAKQIMANSHPEVFEADPDYPARGPVAT